MFAQQMFPVRANGETFRETTMFPQQCFLVCGGLKAPYASNSDSASDYVASGNQALVTGILFRNTVLFLSPSHLVANNRILAEKDFT